MEDKVLKCENSLCMEKFINLKDAYDEMKSRITNLESKLSEAEKNISKIDNTLSISLVELQTKVEMWTKMTNDKVDKLIYDMKDANDRVDRKLDEYIRISTNKQDSFKDWLQKFGTRMLETAVYAGIIYAVLTNSLK